MHQEGYECGFRGMDQDNNPYPEGIWTSEVWSEGWRRGDLERRALSEPILVFPG
ncbi:ribosome modulation factor [Marinobacter salicampi]|uniref:ribosome modulation factor n=1 Tax=Marinobacter salicampi TaxID=435907 RepID=UPI003BF85E4A